VQVQEALMKNIKRRMTPQPLKIRADVELTCFAYDGVERIRDAMRAAQVGTGTHLQSWARLQIEWSGWQIVERQKPGPNSWWLACCWSSCHRACCLCPRHIKARVFCVRLLSSYVCLLTPAVGDKGQHISHDMISCAACLPAALQETSTEDCPVKVKLVAPPLYVLTTQTLDKVKGVEVSHLYWAERGFTCTGHAQSSQ
jgi:hypothetical protein